MKTLKAFLKNIILAILTRCARQRLARMRRAGSNNVHGIHGGVKIIGITGSIGKTTCKEAISHVLAGGEQPVYKVLSSKKSYNTEFGLPLTILELESEFSSMVGWGRNIGISMWRAFFGVTNYDFLILEMGVDKPGDMDKLLAILEIAGEGTDGAIFDYTVLTGVHPVHMADGQFAHMDAIFDEKVKLLKATRPDGAVFLNYDDERCRKFGRELQARVRSDGPKIMMYGFDDHAKLFASGVRADREGIFFEVIFGEVRGIFHIPILGKHHIRAVLPAIGCGLFFGMYMLDIADRLKTFHLPPGRLSLIPGVNDTWIIDSTYNASPDAVRAAIDTLVDITGNVRDGERGSGEKQKSQGRRIFVFGNMNELGSTSEKEHRDIASFLDSKVDMLITVGDMAALCAEEVLTRGILELPYVKKFPDSGSATTYILEHLRPGDTILVKGSQNEIRLERLVKAIMKDPATAPSVLVRQDWPEDTQ